MLPEITHLWEAIKSPNFYDFERSGLVAALFRMTGGFRTTLQTGYDRNGEILDLDIVDCGCATSPLFAIYNESGEIEYSDHDPRAVYTEFLRQTTVQQSHVSEV